VTQIDAHTIRLYFGQSVDFVYNQNPPSVLHLHGIRANATSGATIEGASILGAFDLPPINPTN
jgi:hypothetical protein